jgi:hypothetical protein
MNQAGFGFDHALGTAQPHSFPVNHALDQGVDFETSKPSQQSLQLASEHKRPRILQSLHLFAAKRSQLMLMVMETPELCRSCIKTGGNR